MKRASTLFLLTLGALATACGDEAAPQPEPAPEPEPVKTAEAPPAPEAPAPAPAPVDLRAGEKTPEPPPRPTASRPPPPKKPQVPEKPAVEKPGKDWSAYTKVLPFVLDAKEGLAKAKADDKPAMLFYTATW